MATIKKLQHGLPTDLARKIHWVNRSYRTNRLSHLEGGGDIVVEYENGSVLGYDWIKFPPAYISKIFSRRLLGKDQDIRRISSEQAIDLIHEDVVRIYARPSTDEEKIVIFEEVWNRDTQEMPWDSLAPYNAKVA
ncbi:MAG: hypothetical protein ABR574_11215 [Cryomorphaceae bacterium]|nr:hypothetical protein [Flavobacteriales bacterium]